MSDVVQRPSFYHGMSLVQDIAAYADVMEENVRDKALGRCAPPGNWRMATSENYARYRMGLAMDRMVSSDCPAKRSQSARWAIAWGMALRKARSLD